MTAWPFDVGVLASVIVGDALGDIPAQQQAIVLALVLVAAVWARSGGRARVLVFVACCLMWSRANHAFEGAVLYSFSPEHGLTVADLLPPVLGGWVLLGRLRRLAAGGRRPTRLSVTYDRTCLTVGDTPTFGPSLGVALRD
jgi:hypothetical protein